MCCSRGWPSASKQASQSMVSAQGMRWERTCCQHCCPLPPQHKRGKSSHDVCMNHCLQCACRGAVQRAGTAEREGDQGHHSSHAGADPSAVAGRKCTEHCRHADGRGKSAQAACTLAFPHVYGSARALRHCSQCNMHVLGDERHMLLECPAMQPVWDRYAALFGPGIVTVVSLFGSWILWPLRTLSWTALTSCMHLSDESSNQP